MKWSSVSCSSSSTSSSSCSSSSCVVSGASPPHNNKNQSVQEKKKPIKSTKRKRKTISKKCPNANIVPNANNNNTTNNSGAAAKRSSIYRGVTRHRWTGRFEAHLWDKSSWNNMQGKKGKQVYLGAYDNEEAAAHTYDLAALKYWGTETTLNFPIETYTKEIEEMAKVSKEEYLASLRRQSSGFSRGVSKYRGVARHHHNGRWEARIGRVYGNKHLYLGTYNTQEEAAAAYDMAAIEYRGPTAVTNFDVSRYLERLKAKGIPIQRIILQDQRVPNSSTESEEAEAEPEVEQPTQKKQKQEQEQEPDNDQEQDENQGQDRYQDQELKASSQEVVIQCTESEATPLPCIDTTPDLPLPMNIAMDPIAEDELNWNFYMDAVLSLFPPMPELPLGNTYGLPDVGFEDDIDLIFNACSFGDEVNFETILDDGIGGGVGCGVGEVGGLTGGNIVEEENGKEEEEKSFSSNESSSPCSTTTTS